MVSRIEYIESVAGSTESCYSEIAISSNITGLSDRYQSSFEAVIKPTIFAKQRLESLIRHRHSIFGNAVSHHTIQEIGELIDPVLFANVLDFAIELGLEAEVNVVICRSKMGSFILQLDKLISSMVSRMKVRLTSYQRQVSVSLVTECVKLLNDAGYGVNEESLFQLMEVNDGLFEDLSISINPINHNRNGVLDEEYCEEFLNDAEFKKLAVVAETTSFSVLECYLNRLNEVELSILSESIIRDSLIGSQRDIIESRHDINMLIECYSDEIDTSTSTAKEILDSAIEAGYLEDVFGLDSDDEDELSSFWVEHAPDLLNRVELAIRSNKSVSSTYMTPIRKKIFDWILGSKASFKSGIERSVENVVSDYAPMQSMIFDLSHADDIVDEINNGVVFAPCRYVVRKPSVELFEGLIRNRVLCSLFCATTWLGHRSELDSNILNKWGLSKEVLEPLW